MKNSLLKKNLVKILGLFQSAGIYPLKTLRQIKALPVFLSNICKYKKLNSNDNFRISLGKLSYHTGDRYEYAGDIRSQYFFQDIWAANYLYKKNIREHLDIGSRLNGFVGHLLPFCKVKYVDIRDMPTEIENLEFIKGSIVSLPFRNNSQENLSCLHVIEHIGLGRYGDEIDPFGHQKSAQELTRVLSCGGTLIISVPVGEERLNYDAHRVFHPDTVLKIFSGLNLTKFCLITDKLEIIEDADFEKAANCIYGCGIFVFRKPE